MAFTYLSLLLQWLYPFGMFMALLASLRYVRIARSLPMMAVGFGLTLAVSIFSKLVPTLMSRVFHLYSQTSSYPYTSMSLMFSALSVVGIIGWGLIAFGLYSVMEEVSQKLALLQVTPQDGWNYQAAPNAFQAQTAQNPQVQNSFVQSQPLQTPFSQPSQEPVREEAHAPAYVSPAAPAPMVAADRPVVSVQPEQPDAPLTLGSSR